jgi:hypothetical protein
LGGFVGALGQHGLELFHLAHEVLVLGLQHFDAFEQRLVFIGALFDAVGWGEEKNKRRSLLVLIDVLGADKD